MEGIVSAASTERHATDRSSEVFLHGGRCADSCLFALAVAGQAHGVFHLSVHRAFYTAGVQVTGIEIEYTSGVQARIPGCMISRSLLWIRMSSSTSRLRLQHACLDSVYEALSPVTSPPAPFARRSPGRGPGQGIRSAFCQEFKSSRGLGQDPRHGCSRGCKCVYPACCRRCAEAVRYPARP